MLVSGALSGDKGCGHRGANIQAIQWPPTKPAALPPQPVASLAPRNVDQAVGDKADERGRGEAVASGWSHEGEMPVGERISR